jgi:hypothetical protein
MITRTFFSELTLWLFLVWLFQMVVKKISRPSQGLIRGVIFLFLMMALAASFLLLPIDGLSVVRWIMSFTSSFSIPLTGLLVISILENAFSWKLFSPRDWHAAWFFGALGSLVLYPSALGLGRCDTYSWGWNSSLFLIAVGVSGFFFICLKNRFSILLILAFATFQLQLQPSTNFWDYLIDPFYGVLALVMTLRIFLKTFGPA